jgi:tetratricopeptide (TPR) repeat protein
MASRVAHPNVCRVHEMFEDRGVSPPRLFYTMELLEGETLSARLERTGTIPAAEALTILRDLCGGLEAAHAAGVIHRDLKPANIVLTTRGDRARAVITDFGLAKPDLGGGAPMVATATGLMVGTPAYMAPEQVRGTPSTPATDIYALGLVLYEMLKGEQPFRGSSNMDSWMRRAREGPAPLARTVPGAPPAIDSVLRRCLAYEAERRFQTPRALLSALSPRRAVVRRVVAASAVLLVAAGGTGMWLRRPMSPPPSLQAWYDEAQQAVAEGAATRASNALKRVLASAPGFPPAYALQAEIHLEMGLPGDAIEDMARASRLVADGARLTTADGLYVTGMHALVLHDCEAAVAPLRERAAISDAARPYWMVTAARAMERCNQFDGSLAVLKDAAALDPRNAAIPLRTARPAGRRRRYADAMAALDRADELFRDRNNVEGRTEVLVMRGTLLAEREQLDDADEALASALKLAGSIDNERQQIHALLQQAIVARKRGSNSDAAQRASEALTRARRSGLEPLVVEALFVLGNVHLVALQFDAATTSLDEALKGAERLRDDESVAGAHLRLASLFVAKGDAGTAARELARVRRYYETTRDVRNLGKIDNFQAQVALQQGDFATAETSLRLALKSATVGGDLEEVAEARRSLASVLAATGAYAEAAEEYSAAAAYYRDTKQPVLEALQRLSELDIRSRMGRRADTEQALAAATALAPPTPEVERFAREVGAGDAVRRGDLQRALTLVDEARRGGDDGPWLSAATCLAAARLGQRAVASAACTRVMTTSAKRQVSTWLPAALTAAEGHAWLGDMASLRSTLRDLAPVVTPLRDYEGKWKHLALSLMAATRADRPGADAALTRELEQLRLRYRDAYGDWRSRPDINALFRRIDFRERN